MAATPNVTYTYDEASVAKSKGRVTRVSSSASISDVLAYDALGRITSSRQTTSTRIYGFSYSYDRAGNLLTETYPSGRVATTSYDIANRVGTLSDSTLQTYADNLVYAAHGAVAQMRLGNGRWEKATFNSRLQSSLIGLGSVQGATDLLSLGYGYGTTNNNGNVLSQTITVPGSTFTQAYGYDGVNRLQTASETPSAGTAWSQSYDHDRFGNHWVTASPGFTLSPLTPTAAAAFNAATNRLSASGYDFAGNQIVDAQSRTFTYDGENRQATGPGGGSYVYDGEGRRVSRTVGAVTTFFAYDALGRLGAESATSGVAAAGVNFITQDHLGSTRLVTNAAGSVIGRHDFLPFGEEIPASIGNRNAIAGYNAADSVRHKYTGKERDPESGLDFFQARYDSSPQGRFTSVDPEINWGNNPIDPQRWNHYAYVADRPLIYVDPDGMDAVYRLVMTFAFGPGYVQEHGDRSTLDILLARETVAQTAQGAQVFRQEHQEITHGFSPVPTTSTDGVLLIGALRPLKIGGQVISAIGKDKKLVALAEEAGPAVQRGLDSLVKQLAAGNLNPGIGTKHLFGDIFYARSRDGARVFFRQVGDKIEILGKAAKKNEEEVIRRLTELYKGPK